MRRSAAMALAAALAAGCNNTAPSADPFAPRLLPSTRVPPPGTGTAGGAGNASYYTAPTPGPLPTPAPAALPAAGGSGADVPSNGPFRASPSGAGSFTPNQSSTPKPSQRPATRVHGRLVDRSVVPASHVADVATTPHADDESEEEEDDRDAGEVDEALDESDDRGHGLQPTSTRFARTPRSKGAVDIMDLPPVRR